MKYIRLAVLAVLLIVLLTISLANRQIVELALMPEPLERLLGVAPGASLPLFIVVLGSVVVGLLIGYLLEWVREHKHRVEARNRGREIADLRAENARLRGEKNEGKDEVLAILDDSTVQQRRRAS
ncbi:lipopolysaccharide assembly protein LapA domain-containing protein [Roseicyclus sp. F158]|uniref:Lipopolysaccharide assembly protein LapA domain-containing protein n=1 Tax=Tropicimonas omnivorans TaxID=3075590 RepID=A0ABU3DI01_9RHOB|nr:lipopolysaccharide assembly protein LapA domain-containing protein [Roseicyclus sp. F158]MDT0682782.1 lipopolysaccharide assembly protein LapA domain-containing protein [Roseicyclus sp. F158]